MKSNTRAGTSIELASLRRKLKILQKERDILRALVDNLPDSHCFVKDRKSRFIFTNSFMLDKIIGAKSLEEIVGKTDFDLFPKKLAEKYFRDEQRVIRTGKPIVNREEKTVDKDGNEYWLLTTKVPLFSKNGKIVGIAGMSRKVSANQKIVGVVGLSKDITAIKRMEIERKRIIKELQKAIKNVRTLSGLLPICFSCKKIRDDQGYWEQVDKYIEKHSEAEFTHGLCPDCSNKIIKSLDLQE
ncbi:MAG: hypothetical protein A2X48_13585 [Lentisphaerae bacterium GWF2_49_21]|nr:MAG: hypothetical protein A2X48_13585 [Lentisphaerae bacterium GWF2_49_21]